MTHSNDQKNGKLHKIKIKTDLKKKSVLNTVVHKRNIYSIYRF